MHKSRYVNERLGVRRGSHAEPGKDSDQKTL